MNELDETLTMTTTALLPGGRLNGIEPELEVAEPKLLTAVAGPAHDRRRVRWASPTARSRAGRGHAFTALTW